MDERLLTRLRESGQDGDITATLEHGDAAFALSAAQLGYVDAAGARSVALRDINRIHSDRDGVLRVETPAGTAITASLLGFDPAGVQGFFNEVRVATNAARSLPQAPLPKPAQNGPWKTGWGSAPAPAPAPQVAPTEAPVAEVPAPEFEESVRVIPRDEPAVTTLTPEPVAPPTAAPTPEPSRPAAKPVVISTMPRYTPDPAPKEKEAPKPAPSTPREPKASKPTPTPRPAPTKAPQAQAPAPVPAAVAPVGSARDLASLAESVERLTSTLRLLAVAMGLAAILVGVLRFRDNDAVTGLWIVGSGLVAAFALLVFAQVARLLVGMARHISGPRTP